MGEQRVLPHKYDNVPREIAEILMGYELKYFRENKPVPFCGLLIYPVLTRDYEGFLSCLDTVTVNRKATGAGLMMTDLGYAISLMKEEGDKGRMFSSKFQHLMCMVFHLENGLKCKKCGALMTYSSPAWHEYMKSVAEVISTNGQEYPVLKCPSCGASDKDNFIETVKVKSSSTKGEERLYINGQEITPKDYTLLRYIIPFQNMPDYRDDSGVDPALKKDFEARAELESRKRGKFTTSLERKVIALSLSSSYKVQEIYDMPLRTFNTMYSMMRGKMDYLITKLALMTGLVSFKKDRSLDDWVSEKDDDMYAGIYKDLDQQSKEMGIK
jgi:DNA-directed RNA polymerase subunit M/transcription elongation factor TFIIS